MLYIDVTGTLHNSHDQYTLLEYADVGMRLRAFRESGTSICDYKLVVDHNQEQIVQVSHGVHGRKAARTVRMYMAWVVQLAQQERACH